MAKIFSIQKAALTKALLYEHLINILVGLVVFTTANWLLKMTTLQSVVLTVLTTVVMSVLISVLGTRRLNEPLDELDEEISTLHEKVSTSTSALAQASQDTAALLEHLPIGFLVLNKNSELIKYNQRTVELLGFEPQTELTTATVMPLFKQFKSNGVLVNFVDWLHEARSDKIQDMKRWPLVVFKQAEETFVCDVLANYTKQDSNEYELVIMLIDRREDYERQEKQMEFISLAAHELRGPITIMRGLIDILEDEVGDKIDKEHTELITRMSVSARQLAGYVDNILNVSRVDRDTFEIQANKAQWHDIVAQVATDLSIRAKAHHRKLEVSIPEDLPEVAVDSSAILHVLNNLIDNAIKYSPENGTVVVTSKVKENTIETTIQDFGIGIPANVVNNLFTKFYRSHKSKQIVSGTGLGLYLCKTIIEAHGGNIWVRSTEGAGTTFGFTLPTYASVADQLKKSNNTQRGIIRGSHGWIKNHALYRK